MRSRYLLAALFAVAFAGPAAASQATPEQQVLAADKAWVDSEVAGDRTALSKILDDHFVATFDTGDRMDKAQYVKTMIDDTPDPTAAQKLSNTYVMVDKDTAVVIEDDAVSGTDSGKPYAFDGRLTAVYVLRGGDWKPIALHFVRKRPAK